MKNHDTVADIFERPSYWQARAAHLEKENAKIQEHLTRITQDREFVVGWTEGFDAAVGQALLDHPAAFAAALRAAADRIEPEA